MEPDTSLPPLLVLTGPTAVGKSALAVRLALALHGEIVTADSRQVYRTMDIGTDKPDPAARAAVPHHLIDLVNPDEYYSLAVYLRQAHAVIGEIGARGRLPILVGGTPQYITAMVEGWQIPEVTPDLALRARLEARAAADGPAALHAELARLDPASAATIQPTNTRRLVRALEVVLTTGTSFAAQQVRHPPPYRLGLLALTAARPELYRRIDARVDEQIARGLVEETRALHARGYGWALPAMSGLGYRQIGAYLRGEMPLADAIQRLKFDTHRFVRHQYTWFRRDPRWHWVDTTGGLPFDAVLRAVEDWRAGAGLGSPEHRA
jgi:tRNA dimethylallyltransferase